MNLSIKGWSQVEYLSQTYQPGSPRACRQNAELEASENTNLKLYEHQAWLTIKKYGKNSLANLDHYFV